MHAIVLAIVAVSMGVPATAQLVRNDTLVQNGLSFVGKGVNGKEVKVYITPAAFRTFTEFGYTFPVAKGVLMWCHHGLQCVPVGAGIRDEYTTVSLNIMQVATPDGKKILICRSHTLVAGGQRETQGRPERRTREKELPVRILTT
jgi:hypothetical protein